MAHIKVIAIIVLPVVLLYALIIFVIKNNLGKLVKRFGGKVTSKIFGADYILNDMELTYNFGTQNSSGVTNIKVINKPKKPLKLSISPKLWFSFSAPKTFEEIYDYKCSNNENCNILTDDLKQFLVKNKNCIITLTVNQGEFCLSTRLSPIFISKIEKCMEFLLLIRERINEYELNAEKNAITKS